MIEIFFCEEGSIFFFGNEVDFVVIIIKDEGLFLYGKCDEVLNIII